MNTSHQNYSNVPESPSKLQNNNGDTSHKEDIISNTQNNKINQKKTQSPNKYNKSDLVGDQTELHLNEISKDDNSKQITVLEKDNGKNNAVPNISDINTSTNNNLSHKPENLLLINDDQKTNKINVVKETKKRGGKGRRKKDDESEDESFKIDEEEKRIFNQLKDINNTRLPGFDQVQKERPKPIIDRNLEVEHVVNLDDLNKKTKLTNSELLFAILEITRNTKYYGMSNSTKSRNFWEILESVEDFQNVFGVFKAETLRKYWRILSSIEDTDKLINVIKENDKLIDNPVLK